MCGRYATTQTSASLNRAFEVDLANSFVELEADYNMAPTKLAPIVIGRPSEQPESAERPLRELMTARWGLIPSWAKDPSIGNRLINARSETVAEKPAFKKAFARRRALVPADGYYEWYAGERTPQNRTGKQPFYITPKDGSVLAMAGLYEFWKDKDSDEWVISYTILTTTAEDDLGHVHERMPMFVEPGGFDAWLDPSPRRPEELLDLLVPAAPGRLDAFAVSTAVNDVRHNGAELIAPLPPE
jgi:putative SOS response-associated peptidase YedK